MRITPLHNADSNEYDPDNLILGRDKHLRRSNTNTPVSPKVGNLNFENFTKTSSAYQIEPINSEANMLT